MIKDQRLAEQLLEMMNTALEACEQLTEFLKEDRREEFEQVGAGLYEMLQSIQGLSVTLQKEENGLKLPEATKSVMISLIRILHYVKTDLKKALSKIEFELIPLIEEMRINFFYWGKVYPDAERMKKYYEKDIYWLATNKYTKKAEETGTYKYDLSIFVMAYNKVGYTKICLENLYKNLPKDIKYEIIFLNHGSDDGTKELFEAYHPDKQLDIAVNGGGLFAVYRIIEGKYVLMISNDVVVTKNAIDNLYQCINSDEKTAWVVPTTPNVSNLQMIPLQYSNFSEMASCAEKNNILDHYRWEQRSRLCNPIDMTRASFFEKTKSWWIYHSKNWMSFPDDRQSLLCRRYGYKMYLAKDSYCHHFGSVTLGTDAATNSALAFQKGREDFIRAFGIDPWDVSCCYSPELIVKLKYQKEGLVRILGLECGLGSNPLKIKEELKEIMHNESVQIVNVVSDKRYCQDLQGVSDEVYLVASHGEIKKTEYTFDYIVNETYLDQKEELLKELELCKAILKESGIVILCIQKALGKWMQQKSNDSTYFTQIDFVDHSTYKEREWVILHSK